MRRKRNTTFCCICNKRLLWIRRGYHNFGWRPLSRRVAVARRKVAHSIRIRKNLLVVLSTGMLRVRSPMKPVRLVCGSKLVHAAGFKLGVDSMV